MISITINGKEIALDKPVTVLNAAKRAGIKIPTLCSYELLEPYGGCRLCVVEVERLPKLQTACTLMAADGMVIKTESDAISDVRRGLLELLLINHPLDCPQCDKAGECELQNLVGIYGAASGRYKEEKRKVPASHEDKIISRNMERCVLCTRCVRTCDTVQGASAISVVGRGGSSRVEPFSSKSFNCEYCGNCLTACPVGAILSRVHLHSYRLWQIDREVETICPYCGVGCSLVLQVRDESIKRAVPKLGLGLNNGLLCSKGRFGYEFAGSPERLKTPLVRIKDKKEGSRIQGFKDSSEKLDPSTPRPLDPFSSFREATWEEALSIIAEKLTAVRDKHSGDAIAGIASARCTNEDNYVFQKFMRTACRTNHIDSVSRAGFAGMQKYFEDLLGQGITSNLITGLKNSDAILAAGEDPTAVNPVLGLSIRAAAREGAKIAVIGNMPGLKRFKTHTVIPPLFKEAEVLEALLAAVAKVKGIRGEKPAIDSIITGISQKSPEQNIEGLKEIADVLLRSGSVSIVLGADAARREDGHRTLFAIAGLTYLLEARLYLLSERPNEQGLIDMGCLPDMLPGGRPLGISDFRKRFETEWKTAVPVKEGLTLMKIIEAAKEKKIKAMYIMGENPVFNLPDGARIKESLSSLDFLVVQDIFLTETAELADVVLPAACWPEKEGTFTNLERRVQLLRKAVNASPGMEDWRIITALSGKMGCKMAYSDAEEIMQEIARVSPLYKDLTYGEIAKGTCLWPYYGEPLRGWLGEVPAASVKPKKYNAEHYIAHESILFHSGTLSRRASALKKISPEPLLKIGAHHAGKLSLKEGDVVSVSSAHGSVKVLISIDLAIKDNKALLSNNFEGAGVFSLIGYNMDPVTNIPGIEGCEVTINKL